MFLILGTTASGKARLAFELAKLIGAEIISIDSMKIYRRMDIGTAKPSQKHRKEVSYHGIDVVEPSEPFSVANFLELANQAVEQIKSKNKPVIAVGGTALYIKALLFGLFEGPGSDPALRERLKQTALDQGIESLYKTLQKIDPQAANRIHLNDSKRIIRALEVFQLTGKPISSFQMQWNTEPSRDWTLIGLRREKEVESKRMNARVIKMIDDSLVCEVKALLAEEKPLSQQAACAIGYAEIIDHLNGKTTLDEAVELIKKNTRKLAKAQRTWFKTFRNVNWLDILPDDSPELILEKAKILVDKI